MSDDWKYQIRITLTEGGAIKFRTEPEAQEFATLHSMLTKHGATLKCQFDAFSEYVAEAESEGVEKYFLYQWTKDTIEDPKKKSKYLRSFTIYVVDQQIYSRDVADALEKDLNSILDNNFIVLELDALNHTPDLQSVVLLILMMRITQIMYLSGNRSQRKLCIIDEAWRLLGRGNAGEFIEEGYRVARKHGGCFMTITQKISDYYSSTAAKVAFMNSDISIYLRQKPEELTQAENEGHIDNSDGKVDILRGLKTEQGKYSELAINSPKGLSVHRFYVDPVAAKLYSTTAKDVDFIMEQQDKGHSVLEAVEMLVANEHKVGTA